MKLVRSTIAVAAAAVAVGGIPSAAWAAVPGVPEVLRISEFPYAGFQFCFGGVAPTVSAQSNPQFTATPANGPQPGLKATLEIARPGMEPFLRRTEATWPSGYVWGFGVRAGTFTPGSYQFRMRAENADGASPWTAWCAFTVT